MERYLIIFKGQVQGVGFRFTCERIAVSLNLTGYAENLDNYDVRVEIQGDKKNIYEFLKQILNCDNHWIMIEDYSIKKIEVIESEKKFVPRY